MIYALYTALLEHFYGRLSYIYIDKSSCLMTLFLNNGTTLFRH